MSPTLRLSRARVSSIVGWFLLLVVLAAAGAVVARRRRLPLPRRETSLEDADPDDLSLLGLSAARPASARLAEDASGSSLTPEPTSQAPSPQPDEFTPRPGGVRLGDDAPWNGRAVPLLLGSLSAHAKGRVAVVTYDGDAYTVLARTDGGPLAPIQVPRLTLDGPTDVGAGLLGGLSSLVGSPAQAIPLGDHVVLVGGDGPATDQYLDLLAVLTPGVRPTRSAEPADLSDADPSDLDPPAASASAPVPRAVLIGQEQDDARDDGRPLAFALVTLADAEERLGRDSAQEVAVAESTLRLRLEAAEGVRRVEPFGDLLFGAFLDCTPKGTAAWCNDLSAGDPPLFIGAVAPADGEPSAVRDAAAEALRDAYENRGAQIVSA